MMKSANQHNISGCCGKQMPLVDARVPDSEISELYNKKSVYYDIWGRLTESRARERAIALADIQDGQTILEVAVGTGLAFAEIALRNPNGVNIGIDVSPGMLEKAKNRMKSMRNVNYRLETGNAFDLDIESGSIDILMNNYMFDLIKYDDMNRVLNEFSRVLKKGGKLILVNMTDGERLGSNFYYYLYRFGPELMGSCRGVRMSDRLMSSGFTVKRREYYQQLLFPSEVILAQK